MKHKIILFFLLLTVFDCFAQTSKNSYTALLIQLSYGGHLSAGDLADRFGNNFSIGGGIDLLTEKGNWILGIKAQNLFSKNVKEDVLADIRDRDGFIIGNREAGMGAYALIVLRERGLYAGGHIGKLFALSKNNPRSGLRATLGIGLLQHKVRIQDESGGVNQIVGDYIKGYDQLSNGLALEQFIGYQHIGKNRGFNFFAGFEFIQAFTKNRRNFNFVTRTIDTNQRFDALLGFRLGWTIPVYIGEKGEDLIY